jgi:hypothetical protein
MHTFSVLAVNNKHTYPLVNFKFTSVLLSAVLQRAFVFAIDSDITTTA